MPISFDRTSTPKVVGITAPTETVSVQELYTAIATYQERPDSHTLRIMIEKGEGKQDVGSGFDSHIVMRLNNEWQIQFWAGVGQGYIVGGNITGGYNSFPVKATGGADTIYIQGAVCGMLTQVDVGLGEFLRSNEYHFYVEVA